MNKEKYSTPNHDPFSSSHYTGFVDELAKAIDLNAGLADALMNHCYTALSMHLAEVLDLDAGLLEALNSFSTNENTSRTEIPVSVDVEAQTATKPNPTPVHESLLSDDPEPVHEPLFSDASSSSSLSFDFLSFGFQGPSACQVAGITSRQLNNWARTGLVEPSVEATDGSKKARLYSFKDILILKLVQRLLDTGVKLQNIRVTVEDLRRRGAHDLARITLFSDGTTVYECTSPEEIVDLLQGGQGVFGISVAGVVKEILRAMADLPLGIAGRDTLSELIKEPTGEMANLFSKEAKLDTAQTFKDSKNMTA